MSGLVKRRAKVSEPSTTPVEDISVDAENLYVEEVFTDLKIATIRRLSPVKPDGSPDESRPTLFQGQTQLMSQMGAVPVSCVIEAAGLKEALDQFPGAIGQAVERMIDEAREMQRQEASRIIVPGAGAGVVPGAGKIKL
jgi:hypothetical protein